MYNNLKEISLYEHEGIGPLLHLVGPDNSEVKTRHQPLTPDQVERLQHIVYDLVIIQQTWRMRPNLVGNVGWVANRKEQ